jgi:choline dehydrogenase-like flavoprotein
VPYTSHDRRAGEPASSSWERIVEVVATKAPDVLRRLGAEHGPSFAHFASDRIGAPVETLERCGINVLAAMHLPFRRRNLGALLARGHGSRGSPRIYVNAVARSWRIEAGSGRTARVAALGAVSRSNNELSVRAGRFVIAAGAIESARLLLELDQAGSQPVLPPSAVPGCYLSDHLSLPIADVAPQGSELAASQFGPRFSGACMRSFRFLDANPPQDNPRGFAHFSFDYSSRGFEVAKRFLEGMQGRRSRGISVSEAVGGTGDLVRLARDRLLRRRLHIAGGTPAQLQLDIEQQPNRENRVALLDMEDAYGRRVASIRWRITEQDRDNISRLADRFLSLWPGPAAGLPELRARPCTAAGGKPHDAYHPVGTCRMGDGPESVVDLDLKVQRLENLWVASTGVLPSAGTANPTFSTLCLTHRLAERLAVAA